jgi:hypothetical protein
MQEKRRAGMLAMTSSGPTRNNMNSNGLCAEFVVSEMQRAIHHLGRACDEVGGKKPYFRLS